MQMKSFDSCYIKTSPRDGKKQVELFYIMGMLMLFSGATSCTLKKKDIYVDAPLKPSTTRRL